MHGSYFSQWGEGGVELPPQISQLPPKIYNEFWSNCSGNCLFRMCKNILHHSQDCSVSSASIMLSYFALHMQHVLRACGGQSAAHHVTAVTGAPVWLWMDHVTVTLAGQAQDALMVRLSDY